MKRAASFSTFNRCFRAGYLIGDLKAIFLAFACFFVGGCSARTIDVLIGTAQTINTDLKVSAAAPRTFRPGFALLDDAASGVPSGLPQISVQALKRHPAHEGMVNDLAVAAGGTRVFSGGDDGRVVLSELQTDAQGGSVVMTKIVLEGRSPVLALALSHDDRFLAVSRTASVLIYDMQDKKFTNELSLVKGRITALAWDPKGEFLALGRSNGDVFCWKVHGAAGAGRNSAEELERYLGAKSPIVSIRFHSSGRAFFAAEASGVVSFWRLLRTEKQIGLRDEYSVKDESPIARERERVIVGGAVEKGPTELDDEGVVDLDASLRAEETATDTSEYREGAARVEDMWVSPDGSLLAVAADNGAVYPVKVRGLVALGGVQVSDARIRSISGTEIQTRGGAVQALAVSQRVNRLKFVCAAGESLRVVAQTELLKNSLGVIRSAERSPILWVAEKTGNLLRFDMRLLAEQPDVAPALNSCGA